MNILSVAVVDPRRRGDYKNPYLQIEIDEELRETGEPREFGHWRIIPHGPYFAIDWTPYNGEFPSWSNGDLGIFNTTEYHREPLVECVVITPTEEIDLALGLERARRLLKREYHDNWHYIMDDIAGQHGEIKWRLQHNPLQCIMCGKFAIKEAFYSQTYLPFCNEHLMRHNARMRELRVSVNS